MRIGIARVLIVAVAGVWLAGCSTSKGVSDLFESKTSESKTSESKTPGTDAYASAPTNADGDTSAAVTSAAAPGLLGSDPNDDLNLGKKQYHAKNYGLAEKHFRSAVEQHPRDAEAWLGLAASYDRLRRFELADRAYNQAIGIVGPTAEILNNQGYSYMLRGDYKRARAKLADAKRKDPSSRFVQNNIQLLEESSRKGKAIK